MNLSSEPRLEGVKGWTEIKLVQHLIGCKSFVSGDPTGDRLRVRYFKRESDEALMARVWFGPEAEGPPGFAHGGALAAALDEAMGGAVWMAGHPAVSVQLTTKNYRPVPLGSVANIEAKVARVEGRKIYTAGHIFGDDDNTFCEGDAMYIELDRSRYGDAIANVEDKIKGVGSPV